MIAQDARWIIDALLSAQNRSTSSAVTLALLGHASRIAYEGSVAIRSKDPNLGVPDLAAMLPDRHADVITRARHATKLLDDNKKTYQDLLTAMADYYALHHAEFTGNAVRFARPFETDLGLFVASSRVLLGTIPLQFRLGIAPTVTIGDLGPLMYKVAEDQGSVLAVLAAADDDTVAPSPTIDYTPLGRISEKDRKTHKYLERRYDPTLPIEAKLLLLMVEGEVATTHLVLPLTEKGHKEAVFRARTVSLFHALRAIETVLSKYPAASSAKTNCVRSLMAESATRRLLDDRGARKIRNRCMHYQILEKSLRFEPNLPMHGIVESLYAGQSFHQLNVAVRAVVGRVAEVLAGWIP